jgi:hypothetical protein
VLLVIGWASAAGAAAGTTAGTAASDVAEPLGDWRVGPVVKKGGAFVYCVAERRYANGLGLVISRSPRDEFNIGLRLTGAHLGKDEAWRVRVKLDGTQQRDRQAVAGGPNLLVIGQGRDEPFYEALTQADTLTIDGPTDLVSFRLKGSAKALTALRDCVTNARAGQPAKPIARLGDGTVPQMPPTLAKLLAETGLTKVGLLPVAKAPAGHGVVDSLWQVGPVISGYGESRSSGQTLASVTDAHFAQLKSRCTRAFQLKAGSSDNLPGGAIRTADVTCGEGSRTTHIALTFAVDRNGLARLFFHEAPANDATAAMKSRDTIAELLKQMAGR